MTERKSAYEDYVKNVLGNTFINEEACLKRAKTFEEKVGKDLSEWNSKEIIDYYKSICTHSLDFLYNIHSVFKKYTTWCMSKNLIADGINHYDEITKDTLMQCINKVIADQRIISREDLLREIQRFTNPRDQFICLACFEGLGGKEMEEIINLKLSDFDTKHNSITLKRKELGQTKTVELKYSEELLNYARHSADADIYIVEKISENGKTTYREFKMAGERNQIVKKILSRNVDSPEDDVKPAAITRRFKELQRMTNILAFNSKALKESGRIYQIKELVKSKGISLIDAIKDQYINDVFGKIISPQAYLFKYNDFLK